MTHAARFARFLAIAAASVASAANPEPPSSTAPSTTPAIAAAELAGPPEVLSDWKRAFDARDREALLLLTAVDFIEERFRSTGFLGRPDASEESESGLPDSVLVRSREEWIDGIVNRPLEGPTVRTTLRYNQDFVIDQTAVPGEWVLSEVHVWVTAEVPGSDGPRIVVCREADRAQLSVRREDTVPPRWVLTRIRFERSPALRATPR